MPTDRFTLDWFSLAGKNALITGGNGGLGLGLSEALAVAGANIMVSTIDSETGDTRRAVEQHGARYVRMQTDISDPANCTTLIEQCVAELGSIDILVNCAGISLLNDFAEFTNTQWNKMIDVNLSAAFRLSQLAASHMVQQRRGKIINICSLYSFLGGRQSPAYAATKHGIAGLTKACCDELAEHNIQVNGIAPGYFHTKLTAQTFSDANTSRRILDRIPAGRLGTPQDLMGTVVFLASRASDYVNGHILTVDGGYMVR